MTEIELATEYKIGSLTDEISLARAQLRRCLIATEKWELANLTGDLEEIDFNNHLVETETTEFVSPQGASSSTKKTRKRPDFELYASRLIRSIESMERTQIELAAAKPQIDVVSLAQELREHIRSMGDTIPEPDEEPTEDE